MNNHMGQDDRFERMYELLGQIRAELSAIKTDLNYHIRRTDMLEEKFSRVEKQQVKLHGFLSIGGWILGIAATFLTVLSKLHII
jgi:hypothetical protein